MSEAIEAQKRMVASAAVAEVEAGMLVGLGTGSTAAYAIIALGERVAQGLSIRGIATSRRAEGAAKDAGTALVSFHDLASVDLCIDGIDEIAPELRAIKGAGGAMLREKIVASSATRMIAIGDSTKRVARLGARPLPIEVLPFAEAFVAAQVERLGGNCQVRRGAEGSLALTDQSNLILDCSFATFPDPCGLAAVLASIPGLMAHGLFLGKVDALYVANEAGLTRLDKVLPVVSGNSS